jgi:hypothetical protein
LALFDIAIEGIEMTRVSKTWAGLLCAAAISLLTACAATIEEPPVLVQLSPQEAAEEAAATITGSRIPRKSTERLVKQTDNAGAKDMNNSRPPEQGPFKVK